MLMFFAVAIPLYLGLMWIHPSYQFLTFFFYWYNFSLWPIRWAIPGAAVITLFLMGVNGGLGELWPPSPILIGGLAISLTVSGVLAAYIGSLAKQSDAQRQLIEELEETRKELANEERRSGMLEERSRLAREIHDTLAQGFISIVTHLEAAEDALSFDEETRQKHLDQARHTARESLVEARRLVRALQPELLESSSLPEALERLAQRWSGVVRCIGRRFGRRRRKTASTRDPGNVIPGRARSALQRTKNTLGRAGGPHPLYIDDLVVMDVQDDGVGFDPTLTANGSEGGFGLRAMRGESSAGRREAARREFSRRRNHPGRRASGESPGSKSGSFREKAGCES